MALLIFFFMSIGIVLILIGIADFSKSSAKKVILPVEESQIKKVKVHSILSSIFPFSQSLLERLKLDTEIKNRLDAAHVRFTSQEFFNLKLILMLLLCIALPFVLERFNPLVFLVAFIAGYILPDLWITRKIAQRKNNIERSLPDTVDLLGLCVEAGLDFTSAVRWIIEKTTPNHLIEELAFVLEEIKWGKPRIRALKDMAKRLKILGVSSFVQTLVQAERMGTSVAEAFNILSEDTRLQRFHQGERFAMQAPIKILIPLIFCILPVIAIVVGGPILLQFMQGGLLGGFGR